MAVTGLSLATALGINGGVSCVLLIIFSILRVNHFTRKFYAPKRYDPEVSPKPKKLPTGLLSWIAPTLFYDEGEMLKTAGMDVVVMVRLLSYGWVLFAFCTFWCCALLMPINATAGFLAQLPPTPATSDLDLLSTSNVPQGSHRMWAHLISAYVVSLVALALLVGFSNDVSRLRARYISTRPRGGVSHSVLITDIPCVDGLGAKEPAKKITGATQPHGYPEGRLDAELGSKGAVSGHHGYDAIDDEVLDPWADARRQLRVGDAKVRALCAAALSADEQRDCLCGMGSFCAGSCLPGLFCGSSPT
ncbi:late exocytosis, associated with Golgi transport-domain-containing protein [Scenedesmus sp. NREL 46B-D3]|nr:late exocytosis, associated with Golgi transport-domain-containing protein [Scenedesmus sp. NREL 46B-D3]